MTLPPERRGHAPPSTLVEQRRDLATALAAGTWRTDPPAREDVIGGVRALRFRSSTSTCGTVLHFHSGSFYVGYPELSGPFAAALAARCNVEVICPDYRLAPEHPFPAGLADAFAVMKALDASRARPLILSGDSAGGGLAAGLAVLAAQSRLQVAGLVLLSPWLDLSVTSRTWDDHAASDPVFSRAMAEEAAQLYLQGHSPRDELASPLFGPVNGLPPTLISIGQEEVLAEDARRYHERMRASGVKVEFHPIAGMEHVAVTRNMALNGATQTFAALADFIARLAPAPAPAST